MERRALSGREAPSEVLPAAAAELGGRAPPGPSPVPVASPTPSVYKYSRWVQQRRRPPTTQTLPTC
eukprot:scaffold101634_cov28-Tisochrysis_lutea.AAC.1